MFTHPLVKKSGLSHEIQKDGTIKTILKVGLITPIDPGSSLETDLVQTIRDYMKAHDNIDRADIA